MSYEISYRRRAFILSAAQAAHYDEVFFLLEECGSNNCWEIGNRRRARNWCCLAAGAQYASLAEVVRLSAGCCGGSLVLYGCRRTKPETYIRTWRNTLAEALPLREAARLGFSLDLFVRITHHEAEGERKGVFGQLCAQSQVKPRRDTNSLSGEPLTEWCFDPFQPEQVKLWLDTRRPGRGWRCVEVNGPD